MKKIMIILISSFLSVSSSYSVEVVPTMWDVRAEKIGVGGRALITLNKDLSLDNQPVFEGWTGGLKSKKNTFKLSVAELVSDNQRINFKQYVEIYKRNNKKVDLDNKITVSGYDFIKLIPGDLSIFIEIKDFKENVIVSTWKGEDVYIEIPKSISASSFDMSYNNLFGTTDKKQEMQFLLSKLPELQSFIKEVQNCIVKKDKNCIVSKVALNEDLAEKTRQQERVSSNFVRRFVLDDPKTCEIYENTRDRENEFDNHIPEGIEKKIDYSKSELWNSLQDAFEQNLDTTFINFESYKYENGIDSVIIFKKRTKKLNCRNRFDLSVYLVKSDKGWTIDRFELTSFDDDFM